VVPGGAELPVVTGGMLAQVERRFRRLDPPEQAALEAASVLGEATSHSLLQAVLAVSPADLAASLELLARRHFLAVEDAPGEGRVAFTHPKIREAVYHSLAAADRLRWHRAAARVLGALPTSHASHSNQAIGFHLSQGEAAEEALPLLLEAGDELLQAQTYGEAAWYLGRAGHHLEQLQASSPGPALARLEGRLWLLRGHLYFSQGRHAEKDAAFLRAWACLGPLPPDLDPAPRAQAALFRATVLLGRGDAGEAAAFLTAERPFIEATLGDGETFLYLHHLLARIHGERQEWAQRREVLDEALARAAAIGSEEHVSGIARQLHRDALCRGDTERAAALRALIERWARPGAKATTFYRLHALTAAVAGARADWETAGADVDRMLELAERDHHQPHAAEARWLQLKIRALSDPAAALPSLRSLAGIAADAAAPPDGRALSALAAAAVECGDWEEAAAAARALLAHAAAVVEPDRHGWARQARLILAERALHDDQPGEARRWLDPLRPDETPPDEFWAPAAAAALRAWADAAAGDPLSPPRFAELGAAAAAVPDARLQAIVRAQLAHVALVAGDREAARAFYQSARPVLLACGSAARLRVLEDRLGVRAPALHRRRPTPAAPVPAPPTEAARLAVRLLGGFDCAVDGRAIPADAWGARKARDLFKFLVLRRGRPIPLDEVLEEFWPDLTVDGARRALRTALYRVRRALEPDRPTHARSSLVPVTGDTVRLAVGPETVVDVYAFEDRLRQATRCEASGDPDTANRIREEALALYPGELLPEDAEEAWARGPREWLREQYLSALARLAEAAARRDDAAAALVFAERMLEADPTHEEGIRALVRALAALGRRSEAVRRFDLYARRLERELDLAPEPETRALVDRLRR
jgi:DNA-binding SARP family transcriptional activator